MKDVKQVRLYGWDSRSETWYGPFEMDRARTADARLLRALRRTPGRSWYGPVRCGASDGTETKFFAVVHDLRDCGVACLYCDDSKSGPAEIIAVIPAERRPGLRSEFAFEFLAFATFLGALSSGAELQVHDAIAAAMSEQSDANTTVVFSIGSGLWPADLDHVLSYCVETVALTLSEWMEKSGDRK